MKSLIGVALCVAQVAGAATAAQAADLHRDAGSSRSTLGAFAGARLSVPLGAGRERKLRAGLTVAPLLQRQQSDGSLRTRVGEGVELGVSGDEKVGLTFTPLARLAETRPGPKGRKLGISTLGWAAIGSVVVIVGGLLILNDYVRDQSE